MPTTSASKPVRAGSTTTRAPRLRAGASKTSKETRTFATRAFKRRIPQPHDVGEEGFGVGALCGGTAPRGRYKREGGERSGDGGVVRRVEREIMEVSSEEKKERDVGYRTTKIACGASIRSSAADEQPYRAHHNVHDARAVIPYRSPPSARTGHARGTHPRVREHSTTRAHAPTRRLLAPEEHEACGAYEEAAGIMSLRLKASTDASAAERPAHASHPPHPIASETHRQRRHFGACKVLVANETAGEKGARRNMNEQQASNEYAALTVWMRVEAARTSRAQEAWGADAWPRPGHNNHGGDGAPYRTLVHRSAVYDPRRGRIRTAQRTSGYTSLCVVMLRLVVRRSQQDVLREEESEKRKVKKKEYVVSDASAQSLRRTPLAQKESGREHPGGGSALSTSSLAARPSASRAKTAALVHGGYTVPLRAVLKNEIKDSPHPTNAVPTNTVPRRVQFIQKFASNSEGSKLLN
ncbi:hypothetical protein C8F04DRAFT_1189546 [Mycena alexandri]|uniref:Uncharacterized protein n=1 Tax=Mycena alexandri TaxID=1745969 RepID=A0AAD6SGV1_9AGAR|nr:hypothetical protein C8F04DRAFT_1189546 [Mycena alexandri]